MSGHSKWSTIKRAKGATGPALDAIATAIAAAPAPAEALVSDLMRANPPVVAPGDRFADLARHFLEPAYSDADWPTTEVPGHWRSNPLFADTDGPVLYRRGVAMEPSQRGRPRRTARAAGEPRRQGLRRVRAGSR